MSMIRCAGTVIEDFDGPDGTLIRFSYDGETVTGTPRQFLRALSGALGTDDEETLIYSVDWLPRDGREWVRFPDLNLVAISAHLDAAGRELALAEAGVR